ncbi:RmlC-type cupin [Heracleum sosnowskyi]|uniref:RmlC-type cupin n=1 Tax=Heracleum sosnowskyi TaxID=360622 RepID=A0AAD8HG02_9APIA|nr:RmlC-type cupin [Heracleum sosnowskyi]
MNPRRSSYSTGGGSQSISIDPNSFFQPQTQTSNVVASLKLFLKKPHAFPFLLFIFLLLTWVSLRLQHSASSSSVKTASFDDQDLKWGDKKRSSVEEDHKANLIRFPSSSTLSEITKDKRGWLMDPVSVALKSGISGGAQICASLHVGEIRPGSLRGNHRHYTCNETFLIWGAKTKFRLQNNAMDKGYAEVIIDADEVGVIVSPSGTAHALVNVDPVRTTFFLGCQDNRIDYNSSTSDFNVWKDL